MTVSIGKKAPAFSLLNEAGERASLAGIKAEYTVLYFYPKDDTPGCTVESKGFSAMAAAFRKAGAQVFGISAGDVKSKARFCHKHGLKVSLLADADFAVSKRYGAYGKKSFMGRSYHGILRKTFVLDKNKKLIKIYDSVKPDSHAEEVLSFLSRAGSRQELLPFENPVRMAKRASLAKRKAGPLSKRKLPSKRPAASRRFKAAKQKLVRRRESKKNV